MKLPASNGPTTPFNPWMGCTKVSAGCANCYAETLVTGRMGLQVWGPGAPRKRTSDSNWNEPLKWNAKAKAAGRRDRVFCASLADVFDAEAPAGALEDLWTLIRLTPNLDWLLLTKRPERIKQSLPAEWGDGWPNVWLGASVEGQRSADLRIPILASIPAKVRFLSCEPLLGPVELSATDAGAVLGECGECGDKGGCAACGGLGRITWVIIGGESGGSARPMDLAWARDVADECLQNDVAVFFKQVGAIAAAPGDRKGGHAESIPRDLFIRQFPGGRT